MPETKGKINYIGWHLIGKGQKAHAFRERAENGEPSLCSLCLLGPARIRSGPDAPLCKMCLRALQKGLL